MLQGNQLWILVFLCFSISDCPQKGTLPNH